MASQRFDDEEVDAIWQSPLGGVLFNFITMFRDQGLLFSQRLFVMRRMIRAMLDAEAELAAQRGSEVVP